MQGSDNLLVFLVSAGLVKKFIQFGHPQCLAVCIAHPGRSQQVADLQVLVFVKQGHEGAVFLLLFPEGEGLLDLRLALGNALGHHQGKEAVCCIGGGVIGIAIYGWQSHGCVPHGIVAVFQCHTGIVGAVGHVDLHVVLACIDEERLSLDDGGYGRKHRHHDLLSVTITFIAGLDAETDKRDGVGHLPVDFHDLAAHRVECEVELACVIDATRARVKDLDNSITGRYRICRILYCGCELCFVALSQESRHVGTHHQRFLCQHFCHPAGSHSVLVIGNALENPCGISIGHLKLQIDLSLIATGEHRSPQGRLDGVLTQDDMFKVRYMGV